MDNGANIQGYGIKWDIDIDINTQLSFIQKYMPMTYQELQQYLKESDTDTLSLDICADWINDYQDANGFRGFGPLLAEAISWNEHIIVDFVAGPNEEAIIYQTDGSDNFREISKETLNAIFNKYLCELNISNIKIGFRTIEQ